ncbi:hypothetical protein ACIPWL_13530 [Streptomyces sp. NPDC090023]|uniref:hypothetical protein n=1 Tax=unclassified Streptomyces TaxID=2593676 RepID=UPI00381D1A03
MTRPRTGSGASRAAAALRALTARAWPLAAAVAVVFVLLQFTAGGQWSMYPDSYRYARSAEQFAGQSRDQAHRAALDAFCRTRADAARATADLAPLDGAPLPTGTMSAADCVARWANAPDITTADPRYQAIFSSRPGYPLLAAPFVGAFGVADGMRTLGLLTAAGCSLLVVGLLRSAGLAPPAALCGQVVFLATPLARWSLQALSEGLVTLCVLGAVWAAVLLTGRRPWAGAPLLVVALAVCAVTRYSTALVLAGLLAAAAVACWAGSRPLRHRGTALLAGLAALGAVVTGAAMSALALPSSATTLQDTFTRHFAAPDVADPWGRLIDLDVRYWAHWIGEQATMPVYVVPTLIAGWALARHGRGLGWFAAATALVGVVQVAAHPLVQEADRLGVLMWVPTVLGLPLLLERARHRTGGADSAADDHPAHALPALRVGGAAAVDQDAHLGKV